MQVKNTKYVEFLKGGLLETIPRDKFEDLYNNVQHKQLAQAQVLFILQWMTGRRPAEILSLVAGDFEKDGSNLKIKFRTLKRGVGGIIILPVKDPFVAKVWSYVKDKLPGYYIFWAFRSKSRKSFTSVKVRKKMPDGTMGYITKRYDKPFEDISDRMHYWFKKWTGLPAYYFRHNRFTRLSEEGLGMEEIRLAKGSKGYGSVLRYMHASTRTAKKTGRLSVK